MSHGCHVEAWKRVTKFSPRAVVEEGPHLRFMRRLAEEGLQHAKAYRKDRRWCLQAPQPTLPPGRERSAPPSDRQQLVRKQLAYHREGDLFYEIQLFDPCGITVSIPGPQRRLRGIRHLLPQNRPYLLLKIRHWEPDSSTEIDRAQQMIQDLEGARQRLTATPTAEGKPWLRTVERALAVLRAEVDRLEGQWRRQQEIIQKRSQVQKQIKETKAQWKRALRVGDLGKATRLADERLNPLRRELKALREEVAQIPPQHHRPGLFREVIIAIGLDGMSPRDQKKWRRLLKFERCPDEADGSAAERAPRTSWIADWRRYERRGPSERATERAKVLQERPDLACRLGTDARFLRGDRYGGRGLYVDERTTVEDLMAQILVFLWQDGMMEWDEVGAWLQDYMRPALQGQQRPEDVPGTVMLKAALFAHPLDANMLRPRLPPQALPLAAERGWFTIKETAAELRLTERQVRYMLEHGQIRGAVLREGAWRIPITTVRHLAAQLAPLRSDDEQRERMIKLRITAQGGDPQDYIPIRSIITHACGWTGCIGRSENLGLCWKQRSIRSLSVTRMSSQTNQTKWHSPSKNSKPPLRM